MLWNHFFTRGLHSLTPYKRVPTYPFYLCVLREHFSPVKCSETIFPPEGSTPWPHIREYPHIPFICVSWGNILALWNALKPFFLPEGSTPWPHIREYPQTPLECVFYQMPLVRAWRYYQTFFIKIFRISLLQDSFIARNKVSRWLK